MHLLAVYLRPGVQLRAGHLVLLQSELHLFALRLWCGLFLRLNWVRH